MMGCCTLAKSLLIPKGIHTATKYDRIASEVALGLHHLKLGEQHKVLSLFLDVQQFLDVSRLDDQTFTL